VTKVSCDMAISVDGFVAGPSHGPDERLGEAVEGRLHVADLGGGHPSEICRFAGLLGLVSPVRFRRDFQHARNPPHLCRFRDVGAAGFEPATSRPPTRTQLSSRAQ
jgi:hypothetical protein